jgi:hypothetical protein
VTAKDGAKPRVYPTVVPSLALASVRAICPNSAENVDWGNMPQKVSSQQGYSQGCWPQSGRARRIDVGRLRQKTKEWHGSSKAAAEDKRMARIQQ